MRWNVSLLSCALAIAVPGSANAQEPAESPLDAVTGGKLLLNLRPRYERVEQDGRTYDASALTMRTLLGWKTASWRGLEVTVEGINVGRANDNYNDTKNGKTDYPVVADPDDTDANQLYADYAGLPQTRIRAGKQSIKLDNVRFIGNVEFRQVMQVFTGVTVENKSLPATTLYAGHLERLKTVFANRQEIELEILHAAYQWSAGNSLIGYGYFLDSPKTVSATGFADNSNQILGLRADGAYPLRDTLKLLYTAEAAKQDDYADGDGRIDAHYLRTGAGLGWPGFYARLDYELLSSNEGLYGFQTPLGTNHLFQGWADLFLTTPPQGIRDAYLTLGGMVMNAKWSAEYHDLRSDFGGIRYGREFDFGVAYPLRKGLTGKFEYAGFDEKDVLTPAAARKPDTEKFWLTLIYDFE